MKWLWLCLFPLFGYAQWSVNDVFKISVKYTNTFSLVNDWENISFSPLAITPTQEPSWLCLLDVSCGEGYLFSHVFVDFEGNSEVTLEVHNSQDNALLTRTNLTESGSLSLDHIYQRHIDVWVYLSPQTKLYSLGIVRKKEIPLSSSHVLINPRILYYPEGILAIDLSLQSPAYLEIELYNKRGDRLASLIPMSYYTAGPLSLRWTPLSLAKTYLMSGSAYVYIRYRIPSGSQEWAHRFEIVYL
ncbi:MAG: hypothetical protein N2314_02085 [Brevinematales bacterium]|nr:hypothetical protein [Brevinematales bacterium]